VRAQALYNEKLYNINLTDILSDRAFDEIIELIEKKLTRRVL
jgi:hypothetical protein